MRACSLSPSLSLPGTWFIFYLPSDLANRARIRAFIDPCPVSFSVVHRGIRTLPCSSSVCIFVAMVLRGKHPAGNGRNRFFFFFFFVEVVLRVMGIAKLDCAWLQFSGIPPIPSRTCNRFGKVNHPRVAPEARLCAVIFASTSHPRVVRPCLAAERWKRLFPAK